MGGRGEKNKTSHRFVNLHHRRERGWRYRSTVFYIPLRTVLLTNVNGFVFATCQKFSVQMKRVHRCKKFRFCTSTPETKPHFQVLPVTVICTKTQFFKYGIKRNPPPASSWAKWTTCRPSPARLRRHQVGFFHCKTRAMLPTSVNEPLILVLLGYQSH